ncbi:hypothetical protein [Sphingomonas sp. ERG5]|uniref:hypothetical protein n=1 Tax=Sphingomonas sp. ERG5 TaxID=1381597 RepID=UPI000B1DE2E1|nr:hypothetical protein [Sphingomonas sp. ERG5]
MRTGRYAYNETDLAIGGAGQPSSLSLTRTMPDPAMRANNSFGNFASNWHVMLHIYLYDIDGDGATTDYRAIVYSRGLSTTFDSADYATGYGLTSDGPTQYLTYSGGTRTGASTIYTYTAGDGTVVVFNAVGSAGPPILPGWVSAYASSITEPDGTKYTLSYTPVSGGYARLSSVVSSRGYGLELEGGAGLGNRITKACIVNLALTTLPGYCPATALATTSYSYTGERLAGVTGPDGQTASFDYVPQPGGTFLMKFFKPGQSTPWLTNTVVPGSDGPDGPEVEIVEAQSFADGRSYSYVFSHYDGPYQTAEGGTYQDNLSNVTKVGYHFPILPGTGPQDSLPCIPINSCHENPPDQFPKIVYQRTTGPAEIVDPLGRKTVFDYCDPVFLQTLPSYYGNRCVMGPLRNFTDPEGVKTVLSYTGRNVTQSRRIAKPGSGLADIITAATFDCTVAKLCSKPTSITDARGNVTSYTYKPENGEILTETKPADANGIQAVTRNDYVQRYAWVSNGAGGYAQAATPVWLAATVRTCRTTATVSGACAGGTADEVVTSFDYGPDSGPNNLLLRGKVVTADGVSLRTCYGYDATGNKISETSPRAGLAVCS